MSKYSEKPKVPSSTTILTKNEIANTQQMVHEYCIYFLLQNSEIVYVGQSKNGGFDRIGAHSKYSDKDFNSYHIQPCSKHEINELEAEYILKFSPILNKSIPANNKYKSIHNISRLYRFWNIPKLMSILAANHVRIYQDKYVELAGVNLAMESVECKTGGINGR